MVERSGVVAVVDGFRWNHYPVRQVAQITQVEYVSHRDASVRVSHPNWSMVDSSIRSRGSPGQE